MLNALRWLGVVGDDDSQRYDAGTRLLLCCNGNNDSSGPGSELRIVQLTSDVMECQMAQPVHLLTRPDSFDITNSPIMSWSGDRSRTTSAASRQCNFKDKIRLPTLRRYPVPPNCSADGPEESCREELLQVYQEFVLELHKGIHMTQLTANQDYSNIHCQILEDLQTLKVDQGSGCIVEFPLTAVSKVYRIIKNDDKLYSNGLLPGARFPPTVSEHIVVVEFMRRKLAFVFKDMDAAQRFLMCIELLIRRAQEVRGLNVTKFRDQPKEKEAMAPIFGGQHARGPSLDHGSLPMRKGAGPPQPPLCGCEPAPD